MSARTLARAAARWACALAVAWAALGAPEEASAQFVVTDPAGNALSQAQLAQQFAEAAARAADAARQIEESRRRLAELKAMRASIPSAQYDRMFAERAHELERALEGLALVHGAIGAYRSRELGGEEAASMDERRQVRREATDALWQAQLESRSYAERLRARARALRIATDQGKRADSAVKATQALIAISASQAGETRELVLALRRAHAAQAAAQLERRREGEEARERSVRSFAIDPGSPEAPGAHETITEADLWCARLRARGERDDACRRAGGGR